MGNESGELDRAELEQKLALLESENARLRQWILRVYDELDLPPDLGSLSVEWEEAKQRLRAERDLLRDAGRDAEGGASS